jgi:hypothetical protein
MGWRCPQIRPRSGPRTSKGHPTCTDAFLGRYRVSSNANEIQAIADIFREVRSAAFRENFDAVIAWSNKCRADPSLTDLPEGFASLEPRLRESAYAVSYFFEHLGVLVCRDLVPGDVLISTMCTPLVRTWDALRPAIDAELDYRRVHFEPRAGTDFLPHFRTLVRRIERWRAES